MAKKHSLTLSIPTPCHESWGNMTINKQGRHCVSCNKTVIDFSTYTDRELVEFFKKAQGNICGRINDYQANNTIVITEQNNRSFFHKLFLGSALASWLGFSTTAHAQQSKPLTVKLVGSAQHTHALQSLSAESSCHVSGKVINKAGEPMSEVNITIMSAKDDTVAIRAESDSNGNFSADIPDIYLKRNMIIFFTYSGYYEKEIHFTVKKSSYYKVEMKEDLHPRIVGRLMF